MIDWQTVKLGQICTFKYGQMPKKSDLSPEGYPVFSGYRIVGYSNRYHYSNSEIVIVARGVGGTGDIKMSPPFCFLTNLSIVALIQSKDVYKTFLYYRLASTTLWALRTGSAQAQITIERLIDYEVALPPLPTQRKIASILSAYDDLIENNLRRIKILEEMAQTLYREWFVKFRFPGHQKVKMVDSSLGKIPEGWKIKELKQVCKKMNAGGTPSRKENKFWENGTVNWFKTKELTDTFLFLSEERITELGLRMSSAKMFDRGTILMAIYAAPTVGRLGVLTRPSCCNQAAIGFVADTDELSNTFLFYTLMSLRGFFNRISQGAAQQNISKEKVEVAEFVCPNRSLIYLFDSKIQPVWTLLENLHIKNINLRRTRDLLLPKLISGELDVSELDIRTTGERLQN